MAAARRALMDALVVEEESIAEPSPSADGDDRGMPWDSVASSALRPPPSPTEAEYLRIDTWSPAAASPLLSYVPTSAELALMQAQAALVDAVRSQHASRLRIELLPPGLNRAIENSHAYREPLLGFTALCLANALHGLRVGVLFSSAGSAASAADVYSRRTGGRLVGAHVRLGAIDGAVTRERIDV